LIGRVVQILNFSTATKISLKKIDSRDHGEMNAQQKHGKEWELILCLAVPFRNGILVTSGS
jgi:hypothetical protein